MAEHRKINPILKLALELGPILVFFVGFSRLKGEHFVIGGRDYDGFIVMTALFIPLMIADDGDPVEADGEAVEDAAGDAGAGDGVRRAVGLAERRAVLQDEADDDLCAFRGHAGLRAVAGQSYLKLVMDEALPMQAEGWMILTRRIALFFAGLAVANEVVWRMMSTDAWVNFKTFGLTAALFAVLHDAGQADGEIRDRGERRTGRAVPEKSERFRDTAGPRIGPEAAARSSLTGPGVARCDVQSSYWSGDDFPFSALTRWGVGAVSSRCRAKGQVENVTVAVGTADDVG